jgi:hypothetical protein
MAFCAMQAHNSGRAASGGGGARPESDAPPGAHLLQVNHAQQQQQPQLVVDGAGPVGACVPPRDVRSRCASKVAAAAVATAAAASAAASELVCPQASRAHL